MKLCFIDTETTGVDPSKNGIIQVAGIIYDVINFSPHLEMRELDVFDIRLQPHPSDIIDNKALEVNGVTLDTLRSYQSYKDGYSQLLKILKSHVDKFDKTDKMVFIGYNTRFDFDMLRQFFIKNDDKYFGSWFWYPTIDVMEMAMLYVVKHDKRFVLPDFKLKTVASFFDVKIPEHLHDALVDIRLTMHLFARLLELS